VGVACGDALCCENFRPTFYPLIKACHAVDPAKAKFHTELDPGQVALSEGEIDALNACVVAIHLQTSRNLSARPFPPGLRADERGEVYDTLCQVLDTCTHEITGPGWVRTLVADIDPEDEELLEKQSLLIPSPAKDTMAQASGAARDWPKHRGMYWSKDLSTAMWVNGDDHLSIMTNDTGGDIEKAFLRFCSLIWDIEDRLRVGGNGFARNDEFGFLTSCPSLHGTAFIARILFRIPTERRDTGLLQDATRPSNLKLKKVDPQPQEMEEGVEEWELTSTKMFGASEAETVQTMIGAVTQMCLAAKDLPAVVAR